MVVISSMIAVISAVSIYDYYSSRNWQQVTSQNRNDVVFEKRNQKYGAYTIRRDYDKRVLLILLSFVSSIGISYGAYVFLKKPYTPFDSEIKPDTTVISTPLDFDNEDEEIKKEEKVEEQKPKPVEQVANPELIPVDTKAIDSVAIVDELKNKDVGLTNSKGDSTGFVTKIPGGGRDGEIKTVEIKTPSGPMTHPDVRAEYIGGDAERIKFITRKIVVPDEGAETGGKCVLQFVVDESGEISSVKVIEGVIDCKECDREAIKVIKAMPRWKPAEYGGKKVSSYFKMSIIFEPLL